MTMTRLYDSHGSIRCSQCQKVYPGGWLYRCTQDRQLVLEDELEKGEAVSSRDVNATTVLMRTALGQIR